MNRNLMPLSCGRIILFSFFAITILLESCSTVKVVSKYDCNTFANNPVNKKTTWTFFWGLKQPKDINPHCEANFNHMNQVTVKTNFGFMLLSVVTLGIVIPQRVEWCCAPQNPTTETLGTGSSH